MSSGEKQHQLSWALAKAHLACGLKLGTNRAFLLSVASNISPRS